MGAFLAEPTLLAAAIDAVISFVIVFFSVYQFTMLAYILSSWIRMPMSLGWLQRFLYDVCNPYLSIFRRVLPSFGPLDLSPLVGLLVLGGIERVVILVLDQLR